MNSILDELYHLITLSDKDLKDYLKDYSYKVVKDGKTIVDVQNGKNMLEDIEEKHSPYKMPKWIPKEWAYTKKPNSKKSEVTDTPTKTVETPVFKTDDVKEDLSFDNNKFPDINIIDDNTYELATKVGDITLDSDNEYLFFTHNTINGWIPGINNKQLIGVLKNRMKDSESSLKLLKELEKLA